MIVLAAALGLFSQSALADEAPALINQAVDQLTKPYGDMAYAVGLCSTRYPLGMSDPYVLKAKQDVADLALDELNFTVARIEAVSYANGVEASETTRTTVQGCADVIADAAGQVSANAAGLQGLLIQLAQHP